MEFIKQLTRFAGWGIIGGVLPDAVIMEFFSYCDTCFGWCFGWPDVLIYVFIAQIPGGLIGGGISNNKWGAIVGSIIITLIFVVLSRYGIIWW